MARLFALAAIPLATVVSFTIGQPIHAPPPEDNAADVYLRLSDTRESREIGRIGTLRRERMAFVEDRHAEIRSARAHAVLKHEREHLKAIFDASRLERFDIRPQVPVDPYTGDSTGGRPYTESAAAAHARALNYASVYDWHMRDYDGAIECAAGILRIACQLAGTGDWFHAMRATGLFDMANALMEEMLEASEASSEPVRFSPKAIESLRTAVRNLPEHDPIGLLPASIQSMRMNLEWLTTHFTNDEWASSYPAFARHYDRSGRQQAKLLEEMFSPDLRPVDEVEGDDEHARFTRAMNEHWNAMPEEERRAAAEQTRKTLEEAEWGLSDSFPRLLPDDPPLPATAEQIAARLDEVDSLLDRLAAAGTRDEVEAAFATIWAAAETDRTQLTRVTCGFVRGHRHSWRHSLAEHARTIDLIDRLARLGD